jgi:hypothetical protein
VIPCKDIITSILEEGNRHHQIVLACSKGRGLLSPTFDINSLPEKVISREGKQRLLNSPPVANQSKLDHHVSEIDHIAQQWKQLSARPQQNSMPKQMLKLILRLRVTFKVEIFFLCSFTTHKRPLKN